MCNLQYYNTILKLFHLICVLYVALQLCVIFNPYYSYIYKFYTYKYNKSIENELTKNIKIY